MPEARPCVDPWLKKSTTHLHRQITIFYLQEGDSWCPLFASCTWFLTCDCTLVVVDSSSKWAQGKGKDSCLASTIMADPAPRAWQTSAFRLSWECACWKAWSWIVVTSSCKWDVWGSRIAYRLSISRLTLKVGTRGPLRFVFSEFVPHSGFELSDTGFGFTMIYRFCGVAQFASESEPTLQFAK